MSSPYFTPATLDVLARLAAHNDREWFAAHKAEYEALVKEPCLAFIAAMAEPLAKISPEIVASAKPVGGSLFRIHRDTRFAKDKRPYKTHVGINFFHAATKATPRSSGANAAMGRLDAPVCYLHLEPGASFVGAGIWHPQPESLKRIRAYLVNNPASWQAATRDAAFAKHLSLDGESLQRPPAGFDPRHELIDDLKRKDFICAAPLADAELCSPRLLATVTARYTAAAPLLDWLCGALDLSF